MEKFEYKKAQKDKAEADRKKEEKWGYKKNGEDDKPDTWEEEALRDIDTKVAAFKYLLNFDYRTEFTWIYDGNGFDELILTNMANVMTMGAPDKYYRIQDVKFMFVTPLGIKQATLSGEKLFKVANRKQQK